MHRQHTVDARTVPIACSLARFIIDQWPTSWEAVIFTCSVLVVIPSLVPTPGEQVLHLVLCIYSLAEN